MFGLEEADEGFITPGRKKKTATASLPEVLEFMRRELAVYAKKPAFKDKTVCVMASRTGKIVGYGYSTWKTDCNVTERQVLDKVKGASSAFDLEKDKHGTACAEVCALYFLKDTARYSLAFDNVTGHEKRGCANCTPMLEKNVITDMCARI